MRILLAGTGSGCGKTTASILLMAALIRRGLTVAPYKVGPDYIDPSFHTAVCGRPSHNLDSFLMSDKTLFRLLSNDADISVIEGVMGYYDGLDPLTLRCSTWEIAGKTQTPVILIVDASGGATSLAAVVSGFQRMLPDSRIAGILVNRVSGERHYTVIRDAVKYYTGLPCIGYLTKQVQLNLPSRHLGLVPAEETPDLAARMEPAIESAMQTLDLDRLLSLSEAPDLPVSDLPDLPNLRGRVLGVARDEAFHFYYADNLDLLQKCGAELFFFSPIHDRTLPRNLHGLYIGGGFPEVFSRQLSDNEEMRRQIHSALQGGLPCYAECGGLMYLGHKIDLAPMVDFLPLSCRMSGHLQRFGYVNVTDRTGLTFPAHEFHHAIPSSNPEACLSYTVRKASQPDLSWACGFERGHTLGAFAHVHFADRPELIRRFFL